MFAARFVDLVSISWNYTLAPHMFDKSGDTHTNISSYGWFVLKLRALFRKVLFCYLATTCCLGMCALTY